MASTNTWEVPREHWTTFLTQVEALHRDKPVEVELIGPDVGDQILAETAQLSAISTGREGAFAGTIELALAVQGGLDHRVIQPAHVYAIQAAAGRLECLDIEDGRRTKMLIRFKQQRALPAGQEGTPTPWREVLVREYMTSPVRALSLGASLSEALKLMRRHGIRHLPVVASNGRLLGVLSDRHLYLAKSERGIPPQDVTVEEVMTRSPYTVSPDTRLDEAAAAMAQRKYGCAVVLEQARAVGILTTTDALRALVQLRARERGEWLS